jgi:threonine dehydrogenase-like Zn-dependent dehydrogenase
MITHRLALNEAPKGSDILANKQDNCLKKMVLRP